jgi:poly(A) polymerase/tRNA nucleotidyltransferase (CCA-adding enzyme)
MSDTPMTALAVAQKLGVLKYIVPELENGVGMEQNQAHAYTVWEHLLRSCQHAADKKWPLDIRLTALLHDISKPETRRWSNESSQWTFYGHDVVGSRVTSKILENLRFPKKMSEKIVKLVRWHMFFSDTENITLSAVRRIITNVGPENIWDLMNLRVCDRVGTGRPKEEPYRLRKYHAMIDEALRDPISVGMLKIDGTILIKDLKLTPGPKIGYILLALLEEVLEEPKKNTLEYLSGRAKELAQLSDEELKKLGEAGKEKKAIEEEKELAEIRKKHWVK